MASMLSIDAEAPDFTLDGVVNLQDCNRLGGNFGLSAGPDGPTADDWAALANAVGAPAVPTATWTVTDRGALLVTGTKMADTIRIDEARYPLIRTLYKPVSELKLLRDTLSMVQRKAGIEMLVKVAADDRIEVAGRVWRIRWMSRRHCAALGPCLYRAAGGGRGRLRAHRHVAVAAG